MEDIRTGICPICQHDRVLERRSPPRGFHETYSTNAPAFLPARQSATPYGVVRRYVCLRCGFTQEFEQSPELLPITDDDRVLNGPVRGGPFR
jgi:hypothetical protein